MELKYIVCLIVAALSSASGSWSDAVSHVVSSRGFDIIGSRMLSEAGEAAAPAPTCAEGFELDVATCACNAIPAPAPEEGEGENGPSYAPDGGLMALFSVVLLALIGILTLFVFGFVNLIEA